MSKKKDIQPELLMETPAIVSPAEPGAIAEPLELIDDKPDVVKMDLRKFNKAKQKVNTAIAAIKSITIIESQVGVDKMMLLLKEAADVEKVIETKRKDLGDPYRLEVLRVNKAAADIVKDLAPAIVAGKALILAFHKAEEKKVLDRRTAARIDALKACMLTPSIRKVGDQEITDWVFMDGEKITGGQVEGLPDDQWLQLLNSFVEKRQAKKLEGVEILVKEKEGADFFGDEEAAAVIQGKIDEVVAAPRPCVSYGGFSGPTTKGLTKRWVHQVTDLTQIPREYLQLDEKKVKEAIAAGARAIPGIRIYQDESISLR